MCEHPSVPRNRRFTRCVKPRLDAQADQLPIARGDVAAHAIRAVHRSSHGVTDRPLTIDREADAHLVDRLARCNGVLGNSSAKGLVSISVPSMSHRPSSRSYPAQTMRRRCTGRLPQVDESFAVGSDMVLDRSGENRPRIDQRSDLLLGWPKRCSNSMLSRPTTGARDGNSLRVRSKRGAAQAARRLPI